MTKQKGTNKQASANTGRDLIVDSTPTSNFLATIHISPGETRADAIARFREQQR